MPGDRAARDGEARPRTRDHARNRRRQRPAHVAMGIRRRLRGADPSRARRWVASMPHSNGRARPRQQPGARSFGSRPRMRAARQPPSRWPAATRRRRPGSPWTAPREPTPRPPPSRPAAAASSRRKPSSRPAGARTRSPSSGLPPSSSDASEHTATTRKRRRRCTRLGGRAGPRASGTPRQHDALQTLTERQREVAELVRRGHTNRDIATAMFISEKTVERDLARIFATLGVSRRTELALLVAAEGAGNTPPGPIRDGPGFQLRVLDPPASSRPTPCAQRGHCTSSATPATRPPDRRGPRALCGGISARDVARQALPTPSLIRVEIASPLRIGSVLFAGRTASRARIRFLGGFRVTRNRCAGWQRP